jgi:hypothetical protein
MPIKIANLRFNLDTGGEGRCMEKIPPQVSEECKDAGR